MMFMAAVLNREAVIANAGLLCKPYNYEYKLKFSFGISKFSLAFIGTGQSAAVLHLTGGSRTCAVRGPAVRNGRTMRAVAFHSTGLQNTVWRPAQRLKISAAGFVAKDVASSLENDGGPNESAK